MIQDGRPNPDDADDILAAMVADAKEYFGEDLKDNELGIIRTFYRPIAERLAEAQGDIGLVLDSSQIDHASGQALDLLTALIGVSRQTADHATGTVTFSRDSAASQDYTVPAGTTVQTDSNDPVQFETTEAKTLAEGTTSVDAPIEAVEGGTRGNVGANTIVVMPDPPAGVEDVTNNVATDGGSEEETDDELRERAKSELAQGSRASAPALVNKVGQLDGVTSTSIFVNDTNNDNTGSGGLPDHSFEVVVSGGNQTEIAQAILDTKAAGDTAYAGAYGSATSADADLPNGQTMTIDFSRPTEVKIYVDVDLEYTSEYEGDGAVKDRITSYIGGLLSSGNEVDGLGVGENVLYGEVEYAIRDVTGVHDVTNLYVDTTSGGTNQSNISIADSEVALTDATDGSITLTTTEVNP